MKQFLSFLHKEFIHILRDKVTMLILIVMPIVLIALLGYAVVTEVKTNRVVVVDRMHTQRSQEIIEALKANRYSSVVRVMDDQRGVNLTNSANEEGISEILQKGDADAALILDKNHGAQIICDGSEPNQAQSRATYIQQIISPIVISQFRTLNPKVSTPNSQSVVSHMLFNPQMKSEYNFVPGIIGMIIMLICALMTSISIVKEKETGTMEILLASPLNPMTIIFSKLVPYFLVSTVNLITILLLAKFVFGIPMAGSIWAFFLISMVYVLVALALGLLISCLVNSQLAAMLSSILLIIPAVYLSGMAFPIASMPQILQWLTCIVPTRWYIDAVWKILIQGVEFQYLLKDLIILCIMAVIFITISFKSFKIRLE